MWAAISVGMRAIQIAKQDQCVADEVSAVGAHNADAQGEEGMTENKPVQLLCDRRGIYGIGVSDQYDIEALAWACGVDPRYTRQCRRFDLAAGHAADWQTVRLICSAAENHGRNVYSFARRKAASSHTPRSINSRRAAVATTQ
jgi:hypothetical protein